MRMMAAQTDFSPHISGLINRQRLIKSLSSVLDYKLTIICAPPGYGKTTLVNQFVQQSQRPFAWHAIEEHERDLPNLFAKSLAALENVAPGIQQKLGGLSGYTPRELASVVTNYLRDTVNNEFLYILDDVHYLTGSPAAETWLQTLVSALPSKCHLILLSRALPNLPITEMVARREVQALGQEQLCFTPDEIVEVAQAFDQRITLDRARDLYERLEGWPAGTVLSFHPLPMELESAVLKGGKGPEALFEALAVGVLQIQPPALRNFLLESSTLSHLTPELCENVLEIPNSVERIVEALKRHTFLAQIPGGLVYHRLFRQFLQKELLAQNRARFVSLHLKAAWWFEQQDRIEEAVEHYLAAQQDEFAIALCERVAPAYYAQGKVETLLKWKEALEHLSDRTPKLFLMCAKIHTDRYDYPVAMTELSCAERGFANQEDQSGLAEVCLQIARCNLQQGNYEQAAQEARDFLNTWSGEERLRGRGLRTLGFAQMRLGEIKEAVKNLEAAIPIYRADGDAHALSQLLQDVIIAYSQAGRFSEVSACLQEVVALRRSLGSPGALALALNNLGYFCHRYGEYQQALQTLEDGLRVIVPVSNKGAEAYLLWTLGDVKRDLGVFDEALRLYHKALEFIGAKEPSLRCSVLLSISTLCRWQGQIEEAIAYSQEAAALAENHKLVYEGLLADAIGWAALAGREPESVPIAQLEATAKELVAHYAQFETLQALACCIQVSVKRNNQSLAAEMVESALKMARDINTAQPFVAELVHTPALMALVSEKKRWYTLIRHDLDCLHKFQKDMSVVEHTKNQPDKRKTYGLRVWTLGQEIIERDGKRVLPSEWRALASRELFLYLLLVGPTRREELSLNFWPDSSSRQVRANFHTTLYRTRQALGENVIVLSDQHYMVNPEIALWCDVHEMETIIQQAQLLSARDARTEDLWRKAVNLYKGEFLPSITSDWANYYRERLQETYIEAVNGAANSLRARGNFQEALLLLKRALNIDPYREDIYRAVMQCYADLGERKQVLTYYRRLQSVLDQELAIKPSQETETLVERLLN